MRKVNAQPTYITLELYQLVEDKFHSTTYTHLFLRNVFGAKSDNITFIIKCGVI